MDVNESQDLLSHVKTFFAWAAAGGGTVGIVWLSFKEQIREYFQNRNDRIRNRAELQQIDEDIAKAEAEAQSARTQAHREIVLALRDEVQTANTYVKEAMELVNNQHRYSMELVRILIAHNVEYPTLQEFLNEQKS